MHEMESFAAKYPLMCIPSGQVDQLKEVRALSRFPSELKENKLYLGNMTNILNKDYFQLTMLNIKTIVALSKGPFEEIGAHFNYVHIACNEMDKPDMDLDYLSNEV